MKTIAVILLVAFTAAFQACSRRENSPTNIQMSTIASAHGTVRLGISLAAMSRIHPKSDITRGGLLGQFYAIDVTEFAPELASYSPDQQTVLWFYEFSPTTGALESGILSVQGTSLHDGNCRFALINKSIADATRAMIIEEKAKEEEPVQPGH